LTYTPAQNDYGTDSLTFVVNDGQVTSAVATVLITILPVNDSPVAIAKTVTTALNSSVTFTLDGSDPEGDLLTGLIVTDPTNGTASVTGRQILYTPGLNYSGDDQITFRLNDGGASSADATISITVVPPTIAPIVAAVQAPAIPTTVSVPTPPLVTNPPLPWNTANIGVGQAPGSLLYSKGDFVQTGAGALGGTTDKLNFIYQPLTGDGQITVKISANQKIGYSGISIRESLAPNARKIFLGVNNSNSHVMVSRSTTGAKNSLKTLSSNSTTQTWIRLVRNFKKNYFYAYSSSDGVTWRLIGSQQIKMPNTCQVGLSVCSGNDTTTATSTFSNVIAIP
jgi:regulation of enolase protein 1 (concanavalin A-like superfamily)